MGIRSREYQCEEDYQRVRELLVESYALSGKLHNWGIDCWDWFRYNVKVFEEISGERRWEQDVRLWETDAGKLAGVALLEAGGELSLQVHPDQRGIEGEMLAWAEARHGAARPCDADDRPLSLFVYDFDRERQALLRHRGYENLGHVGYMRWRSTSEPPAQVNLPQGYAIRPIDGRESGDLERRATVANRAFDVDRHTARTIQVLQEAPTYRPDLDLVVVAPDGSFAAYCVVWHDVVNRIGWLGPVGTDPAYRRKGLATAVMGAGLRRLQALGATRAYVDCGLGEAPNRCYESLGFADYDRVFHWQKAF